MSLKAFHIFFVAVSVLTAFGFSVWTFARYSAVGGISNILMAIVSVLVGIVLIVYGIRFLKKLKHVSYL